MATKTKSVSCLLWVSAAAGLIGLGVLALVSWRTTGRPGKWVAILAAALCWVLALITIPIGIVGLLSNFGVAGLTIIAS